MKRICIATLAILISASAFAQNNEQKELPDIIGEMVEYLERDLKLEDWQVYKVDSTLMYNYSHMETELMDLRRGGVYNSEIYARTSDRWAEAVDTTFQKHIFTPEQWKRYLKSDYGREKRARDKRAALRVAKENSR